MKLITIAIAFVASAAFANPTSHPAEATKPATKEATKTTKTKEVKETAVKTCTEADAKAGKCTPEMKH